jgi:hypothetical protein
MTVKVSTFVDGAVKSGNGIIRANAKCAASHTGLKTHDLGIKDLLF